MGKGLISRRLRKNKCLSSSRTLSHKAETKKAKARLLRAKQVRAAVLAGKWDPGHSSGHNYRELGLTRRLNQPAGGVAKVPGAPEQDAAPVGVTTATRAETAAIVTMPDGTRVVKYAAHQDIEDVEVRWNTKDAPRSILAELEQRVAENKPEKYTLTKHETAYIRRLQDRYGDDYKAMQRDRHLNLFQYTAARLEQLVKRLPEKRA